MVTTRKANYFLIIDGIISFGIDDANIASILLVKDIAANDFIIRLTLIYYAIDIRKEI